MPLITDVEEYVCFKFPIKEVPMLRNLFTKLHKYKRPAGYTSKGMLELDETDQDYIRQFYDAFEHDENVTPKTNGQ